MLDIRHLGERIRENRKKKMMTIKSLSEYTGLSVGYLSMLEQNKTTPTIDNLARICESLEISIVDILESECEAKTIIRKEENTHCMSGIRHISKRENVIVYTTPVKKSRSVFGYTIENS